MARRVISNLTGEHGKLSVKREKELFAGLASNEKKPVDSTYSAAPGGADHFFIDAIRSGNSETLHCDINEGFYSSALPILANISYRLGSELKFMGDYEKFANDPEADKMLTHVYQKNYVINDEV
jgi:hypothetical protein